MPIIYTNEVTELGWGEFEVGIRLVFHDPSEQPIDLSHHLKLYPPQMDKISASVGKKVSELLCSFICLYVCLLFAMLY